MSRRRSSASVPARRRTESIDWPRVLLHACRLIERADGPAPMGRVLADTGVSIGELRRQFRRRLGTTPKAYAQALRLNRLVRDAVSLPTALDATLSAGFGSPGRGYAAAGDALGVPPGRLRGAIRIDYWMGLSELGWMLMGATRTGICWLAFGDAPEALLEEFAAAFPRATCSPQRERLQAWFDNVREHILLPGDALELPLDVRGTAFQARVWRALRRIPLGETRSYGKLARQLGQPTASRAVAAACAANRVAVVIPCHRVIAADGSLAGYRWGAGRKQSLLSREGSLF